MQRTSKTYMQGKQVSNELAAISAAQEGWQHGGPNHEGLHPLDGGVIKVQQGQGTPGTVAPFNIRCTPCSNDNRTQYQTLAEPAGSLCGQRSSPPSRLICSQHRMLVLQGKPPRHHAIAVTGSPKYLTLGLFCQAMPCGIMSSFLFLQ